MVVREWAMPSDVFEADDQEDAEQEGYGDGNGRSDETGAGVLAGRFGGVGESEDGLVVAFGNFDTDGAGGALEVILGEAGAEAADLDADYGIELGVVTGGAVEDFDGDDGMVTNSGLERIRCASSRMIWRCDSLLCCTGGKRSKAAGLC
jgi:hypothetical protein